MKGRLSSALVLVALTLAGCAAPDATQTASTDLGPLPDALRFAPDVALPTVPGVGAGEPNIAILPDGTIFVTSPTGLQLKPNAMSGAAYLWRSTDGGATWETLREPLAPTTPLGGPAPGPFCSCDADVVATADGAVFYSDWWDGNYMLERSTDGGETWTSSPALTRDAIPFTRVDRQWIVATDAEHVALFYSSFATVDLIPLHPIPEFTSGVHAVFSEDGGLTWSQPVIVVDHGVQIAHPRALPDGTLVMPYGEVDDGETYWRDASRVMLAVSTDGGATFDHAPVAEVPEGFDNLWAVQADVDGNGTIHVAWAARVDDETMAISTARSSDAGATWSAPMQVTTGGLHFLPWVAAAPDGRVAIAWYGGNATGDPTEAGDDAEWFAHVAESADGGLTWSLGRASEPAVKTGPMCPKGASCNGDRELLDYPSLAYAPDGALRVALARSIDGVAITSVATALADASS